MPTSLINAVVDSAVNAGVVPCGNQQPGQISHYPLLSVARQCARWSRRQVLAFRADQRFLLLPSACLKKQLNFSYG